MTGPEMKERKIIIRKRTLPEVVELTLALFRTQLLPIVGYSAVLVVPFFCLNSLILGHVSSLEALFSEDFDEALGNNIGYFFYLFVLTAYELEFVGSLCVARLGSWFFDDRETIPISDVFRRWRSSLGQLIFYLLFLRVFTWPSKYLNEIILLEKTPFLAGKRKRLPTRRRSASFHRGLYGEGILFFFTEVLIAFPGFFILWGACGLVIAETEIQQAVFLRIAVPLYFWGVLLFNVVFRFLLYLNHRIIREGWDVELACKGELFHLGGREALLEAGGFFGVAGFGGGENGGNFGLAPLPVDPVDRESIPLEEIEIATLSVLDASEREAGQ